jgi:hypothetical protein
LEFPATVVVNGVVEVAAALSCSDVMPSWFVLLNARSLVRAAPPVGTAGFHDVEPVWNEMNPSEPTFGGVTFVKTQFGYE